MSLPFLRWSQLAGALLIGALSTAAPAAQTDELQEANQAFKQGQLDRALERTEAYLKTRPSTSHGHAKQLKKDYLKRSSTWRMLSEQVDS